MGVGTDIGRCRDGLGKPQADINQVARSVVLLHSIVFMGFVPVTVVSHMRLWRTA